jgi:hypothetical protein
VNQVVSVTVTWVNHKIIDMYKISHPVSFLCLATSVSILAISEATVTAKDQEANYELQQQFKNITAS